MTALLRDPRLSFTLPALVLALLLSCAATPARRDEPALPVADSTQASPLLPPTALSSDDFDRINASARVLAGEKASGGAEPWESTKEWSDYQKWLDGSWSYLDRVRLSAMRTWSSTELAGLRGERLIQSIRQYPDNLPEGRLGNYSRRVPGHVD